VEEISGGSRRGSKRTFRRTYSVPHGVPALTGLCRGTEGYVIAQLNENGVPHLLEVETRDFQDERWTVFLSPAAGKAHLDCSTFADQDTGRRS
jgi:hypothetical protein